MVTYLVVVLSSFKIVFTPWIWREVYRAAKNKFLISRNSLKVARATF